MKYATYSIMIALCLLASCKEEEPPVKTYCEENPGGCQEISEGKKFFAFKLGSWWVYEEETSGERDSVYMTQSSIDSDGYNFDVRMHSTLEEYEYHYWPEYVSPSGCSSTGLVKKKCIFINRSKGKSGDFIGQDFCFFINYIKGDFETINGNTLFPNNKIVIDDVYNDSYTIGNLSFGKTVKIHELNTMIEGYQPTNHYFSKGVGLIRKELLDSNQIWNLVDYHIEP